MFDLLKSLFSSKPAPGEPPMASGFNAHTHTHTGTTTALSSRKGLVFLRGRSHGSHLPRRSKCSCGADTAHELSWEMSQVRSLWPASRLRKPILPTVTSAQGWRHRVQTPVALRDSHGDPQVHKVMGRPVATTTTRDAGAGSCR